MSDVKEPVLEQPPVREPETVGEALRARGFPGFRQTIDNWNYRTSPRWLRAIFVLFLAGSLALGVMVGYRYFFEDHPFGPNGSPQATSVQAGKTIWVSMGVHFPGPSSPSTAVDLRSVYPHIVRNTADASVAVEMCTGPTGAPLVSARASWVDSGWCPSLTAFIPQQVSDTSETPFVLAITPRHSGVVEIDGLDINLRQGLQRGTQQAGVHWTVTATP